jgi:hypothetical protein
MAEEPEDQGAEIQAMVGLAVPLDQLPPEMAAEAAGEEEGSEPWQAGRSDESWRGEAESADAPRTVMLAFAPLIRIKRRRPDDFGEELADLLESAIAGATRPSLEARVERMLGL